MALLVSQLPKAAMLPTILIVCPYVVVASSLKVTTAVAAHVVDDEVLVVVVVLVEVVPVAVVVEVMTPVWGVCEAGNEVSVADVYEPTTDTPEHVPGTELPDPTQDGGETPARRAAAERKAAYDHVRS